MNDVYKDVENYVDEANDRLNNLALYLIELLKGIKVLKLDNFKIKVKEASFLSGFYFFSIKALLKSDYSLYIERYYDLRGDYTRFSYSVLTLKDLDTFNIFISELETYLSNIKVSYEVRQDELKEFDKLIKGE